MFIAAAEPLVGSGTTLLLAVTAFVSAVIVPVVVAFIGRTSKHTSTADPAALMPRAEFDGLLDQIAQLNDTNDRVGRENQELHRENTHLVRENARLQYELQRERDRT